MSSRKTAATAKAAHADAAPIHPEGHPFANPLGDMWKAMAGLSVAPQAAAELQAQYVQEATRLWNESIDRLQGQDLPAPTLRDRRFAAPDWVKNPAAAFTAQMYLLNANTLQKLADSVEGDEKTKARLKFGVQQWVDAMSPSNYLALNPEAQQKALQTQGESLAQGMKQLWQDIQQGHVSQTDESVFEVGRNVATTEGAVVFENDLFQLLEYKPLTEQVFQRPLLFVPPCINKYYILDLQPDNSLIRYAVSQGHRVFVMSWRNADESMVAKTWDDYVEHGVIRGIQAAQDITGQPTIDTLGFCIGGTLLSTALAVLAARGQHPAASLTLLTTFLDFTNTGVLDVFVDEASVQMRELSLGTQCPTGPGLLKGKELAQTFSFLRPNDLVWNYVVGNYLKGEKPPAFDLLYWNGDSTNLPGPMYCWYLRNTYLENKIKVPGALTVCGESLDLGLIKAPVYIYASREDHIVPWDSAYRNTQVLKGPKRFVLGASGHIAGVINPASKNKRNYWVSPAPKGRAKAASFPLEAQEWFNTAQDNPGSWWSDWAQWLAPHAGPQVPAPRQYGSRQYKAIEAAPGRYVKVKAGG